MTHFIKVSIVIVLVTIVFFNSSLIENIVDPSYNEYDYLRKIRRTHDVVENDNEGKGWQEDGTFKSWYQKGNGSENDKYLNNITPITSGTIASASSLPASTSLSVPSSTTQSTPMIQPSQTTQATQTTPISYTNILPYVLLMLLIVIVSIILYVKYH